MFKKLFENFLLTDYAAIIYFLITALPVIIFSDKVNDPLIHLVGRIVVIVLLVLLALTRKHNSCIIVFIRLFIPVISLSYTYGETAALNHIIFSTPLDKWFIDIDKNIFGFEPALVFSQKFSSKLFGEIMYAGYFSYYFMLITVTFSYFFLKRKKAEEVFFIILTSFYFYYIIFIIFPVVGPQFYYSPPESTAIHTGFFSGLVEWVQKNWEHPTGAFPSSHVGISLIYLIITFQDFKKLFYILLPFVIIILFATVYIKAHYAVDVIAGIVSAPLFYWFSKNYFNNEILKKENYYFCALIKQK